MNRGQYAALRDHLFPGDNNEAIAFALCGIHIEGEAKTYSVFKLELFPHHHCIERRPDLVIWPPTGIVHLLEECRLNGWHLLKIHCHPRGGAKFSDLDDQSDLELSDTLTGWINKEEPIVTAIMLPDGEILGRVVKPNGDFVFLKSIIVSGDDIQVFIPENIPGTEINRQSIEDEVQLRTYQAFGEGTVNQLRQLRIGIVGCSGTGSIVAELLGRLGVGELVIVDNDVVEPKNLNRILNTRHSDAMDRRFKVDVIKEALESSGTGVKVRAIACGLHEYTAYQAIGGCDIVFGCMDSVDGRHLLNRIATFFSIPYFDIGVRLDADGKGGVDEVMGRVDYIQPGGSSLLSRERYTLKQLAAADLARTNPEEYNRQVKEKYIRSANVESPAVISINMMFAAQAVTEFLARIHPFRTEQNSRFAEVTFSVAGFLLERQKDGEPDLDLQRHVGKGTVSPLLNAPTLIVKG